MYTLAYASQEIRVSDAREKLAKIEGQVEGFRTHIKDVSRRHDVLLTYVITLREKLAAAGFQVPPMPPLQTMKEIENERPTSADQEDPL